MQLPLVGTDAVCIVDEQDYALVEQFPLYLLRSSGTREVNYAQAYRGMLGNKRQFILVHNLILGVRGIDHVDGDGLNNARANLRIANGSQNQSNVGARGGASKFKGVAWHSGSKKWMAQINYQKRHYFLGYFTDEVDAAHAYDQKARELHGTFGRYNFPLEGERSAL
jgi:hypothetical protein